MLRINFKSQGGPALQIQHSPMMPCWPSFVLINKQQTCACKISDLYSDFVCPSGYHSVRLDWFEPPCSASRSPKQVWWFKVFYQSHSQSSNWIDDWPYVLSVDVKKLYSVLVIWLLLNFLYSGSRVKLLYIVVLFIRWAPLFRFSHGFPPHGLATCCSMVCTGYIADATNCQCEHLIKWKDDSFAINHVFAISVQYN